MSVFGNSLMVLLGDSLISLTNETVVFRIGDDTTGSNCGFRARANEISALRRIFGTKGYIFNDMSIQIGKI